MLLSENVLKRIVLIFMQSLNPYSVGCYSPRDMKIIGRSMRKKVLILILLDVTLRAERTLRHTKLKVES